MNAIGIRIEREKCTGCPGAREAPCVECCPGDLIFMDEKTGKAEPRDSQDCWDCMACVKACPRGAIVSELPFMLANRGAVLQPHISRTAIVWECRDTRGNVERFEIPTVLSDGGGKSQ